MAIHKTRNEQIENSLLLESAEEIELPPATVDEDEITLQFETFRPFVPELIEELEEGTIAETVPVIKDGSTFAIHGETRTFWVKIWHTAESEMTEITRVQVLNCLPRMRNVRIVLPNSED
ncbi:MAG: hypothetical protein M3209_05770 [Acidobacteriota bacterium]|nr:hypothetical protein [Acidobacteriota bacterium]